MFSDLTASACTWAATGVLLFASTSNAQVSLNPSDPFNGWFNVTEFPTEQKDNVTVLLKQAADLSNNASIYSFYEQSCILQQVYPSTFSMPAGYITPYAAFDNFYFVGQAAVAAWVYNTTEGLVMIDALDNGPQAEGTIVPGLKTLGLSVTDIKHLIITHEHIDHYGGAKFFQDTCGTKVYGSEPFWAAMEVLPANSTVLPPVRNETLVDGQDLTIGDVTFHTVLTPGHTLGTLSLIFPVSDAGKEHVVGFMGGTGDPSDTAMRAMKVQSIDRYATIAREKGVDVLLSNHNVADHAMYKADVLEHRALGAVNPFVIGTENYVNYLKANALCTQVLSAREGKDMTDGIPSEEILARRQSMSLATDAHCNH